MIKKCVLVFMYGTRYSCQVWMKLERFSTDFRKILKYKVWKSLQWKPSCSIRTDIHDEANSRFFPRNFANVPRNYYIVFVLVIKKVAAPVQKTEINGRGDPLRWPRDTPLSSKVGTNFADRRRPLCRYSPHAD